MPQALLTDLAINKLKHPNSGQVTYWDTTLPAFGVRVSQGGTKSYVIMYGKQRKLKTIGRHGVITLSQARTEAKHFLAQITLGFTQPTSDTFAVVLPQFLERHCARHNKPSTYNSTKKLLENNCLPKWRNTRIHQITRKDVIDVLEAMHSRGSHGAANNLYAVISKFFNWCTSQALLDGNPITSISRPSKTKTRDRTLIDKEISSVWKHTNYYPFGTITRLLLLTAARRNEIASMEWDWVDDEHITIPASHTKNSREHILPVTDFIRDTLTTIPRTGDKLFPARGKPDNSFSGFSKCKKRLDTLCPMPYWTLHDLRRTGATHMGALGVQPHVVEAVLNHASGAISGVAGIYNRYSYMNEKREALTLWHDKIQALV